ncbi:MAG: peptidoglycan-associated lipoprotein Pal [Proteobacteria bacterium]|nr:peptidoglycan-associated lipoprotein Pal [Pseudomonadota bacterium]
MQRGFILLVMAALLALSGCASKHAKPDASAGAQGQSSAGTASTDAAGGAGAAAGGLGPDDETQGPQAGLLATRIVYFDFDSSEIKGAATELVAAHAKYLATHGGTRVRLEGHTDERGSREYNIGLGERRAQAVRRALLLQGATDAQITTVSYGAERPAVTGHDEAAWAKNRRVEIVYLALPAGAAK